MSPTQNTAAHDITMRCAITAADRDHVRDIVVATGVFSQIEIDVAIELVDERLAKGAASGYEFIIAERGGQALGYACYGPIALTQCSYDLFWIAVCPDCQGQGIAGRLVHATEEKVRDGGGGQIYIETSSRAPYAPARAFYEKCGYRKVISLDDFYAPGDAKVMFVKQV